MLGTLRIENNDFVQHKNSLCLRSAKCAWN